MKAVRVLVLALCVQMGCATSRQPAAATTPRHTSENAAMTAAQKMAFLEKEPSCALFLLPPMPPRPATDEPTAEAAEYFWKSMQNAVAAELHAQLKKQHRVACFDPPYDNEGNFEDMVMREHIVNQCSRLIQVRLKLFQDATGRFFEFTTDMMELRKGEQPNQLVYQTVYEKAYRFAREPEVMGSFDTRAFSEQVFQDAVATDAFAALAK